MAATTEAEDKDDALIRNDRRITSELYAAVEIVELAVMVIIRGNGYRQSAQCG
jgi:hypothetical protein